MSSAKRRFKEAEGLENSNPREAGRLYWEGVKDCYDALEDCNDNGAEQRIKKDINTYTRRARVLENVERNSYKEGGKNEDDVRKYFQLTEPETTYDDVVGMDDLKEKLDDAIVLPLVHPELFKEYFPYPGETTTGIMLYGPPGCGKTYIAKSIAGEASRRTGEKVSFVDVNIDEVLSAWVGSSEKNLKAAFQTAAENEPCVLFLDEIDAIARNRGTGADHADRLVNQFLKCFEVLEGKKVLILGATNNPWAVDGASLREGRFGDTVYVSSPDYETRREMFRYYLSKRPYQRNIEFDELAKRTDGFSPADIKKVCRDASMKAIKRRIRTDNGHKIEHKDLTDIIDETKPSIEDWKRKIKKSMKDGDISAEGYDELAELLDQ